MIILDPEVRIHRETFCSGPMKCPYCGGKGWFYSGRREPGTIECPDCEGTGEVIAMVAIEWKPSKNH